MHRSSRMKNVKSRENLDRQTVLKDDTTDRRQKKKKLLTNKKRKKLALLNKKNTLMVGMFKNGAKSKEICTAAPVLTASNTARLQGDILRLLNGESKPKKSPEDHLTYHDREKVLPKMSPKKVQPEKPKDPVWSPKSCYKAFCAKTSMDFEDERFLINSSTVTDYVQKIKKNLRQIYADTFHRQILQQKAKNKGSYVNTGTLGLVNALDPSTNINFENIEVPACSYSENSELLLKPMNNIRLDSEQASKESIQTIAVNNTGAHLPKSKTRMESQTHENRGLFSSKSDLFMSDLEKHHLQNNEKITQIPKHVTKLTRKPFTKIFDDQTPFRDNFESLNVKSSTEQGKEMMMKRYLKCCKQPSKANTSFKDNIFQSEQNDEEPNVPPEIFLHEVNDKKIKNIPIFRRYGSCYKKRMHHGSDSIIPMKDPRSVQLTNRDRKIGSCDVSFETLPNESLVDENTKIDYVIKKHGRRTQMPLVNSEMQFMKTDENYQLHSLISNVFQNDCVTELHEQGDSFEIHIPTNNNLLNEDLNRNMQKNKQVLFAEGPHSEPQAPRATLPKQRSKKQSKRNTSNTINSVESGILTTSSVYDFNQPMLFEDSDLRSDDPVITPKPSQYLNKYFNYSDLQHSDLNGVDFNGNFESSLDFSSNSKLHHDRKQRRTFPISKNKHTKSKSSNQHYVEDGFVEKSQQFRYQQNNNIIKPPQPPVENISRQKNMQYLSENKDFEKSNSMIPIPVIIEDKQQNSIYPGMAQGIIQPTKYLAVEQSKYSQQRIPLYLQVTDQNVVPDLPHRQINLLKSTAADMAGASNVILVPKNKDNGNVMYAMPVASHKLLPAYYKTSQQNEYYGKNFAKLIPINVAQSWQPQLENQTSFVNGNIGVNMPNYYVLHNTNNENLVYTQSHYNC